MHGAELMQMTDGELKSNFVQINEKLDLISQHQQNLIDGLDSDVKANTAGILENKSDIQTVDNKITNHLQNHSEKEGSKRFNLEMWVLIGLFALDKIGSWIKMYLPAP